MRMLLITGAVAVAALTLGGPALAAEGEGKKKDPKICKSFAKTSSRIGSDRICKRKSEWEADAIADGISMERFKSENTGRPLVTAPGSSPARRP